MEQVKEEFWAGSGGSYLFGSVLLWSRQRSWSLVMEQER